MFVHCLQVHSLLMDLLCEQLRVCFEQHESGSVELQSLLSFALLCVTRGVVPVGDFVRSVCTCVCVCVFLLEMNDHSSYPHLVLFERPFRNVVGL